MKIEDQLPDRFIVRADAKAGEPPTLGVEGNFVRKDQVKDYIARVKQSNPNGVVLCLDQEEGTGEKVRTNGLKSFGVQGMIIDGQLCPIEFNRPERFTTRDILNADQER